MSESPNFRFDSPILAELELPGVLMPTDQEPRPGRWHDSFELNIALEVSALSGSLTPRTISQLIRSATARTILRNRELSREAASASYRRSQTIYARRSEAAMGRKTKPGQPPSLATTFKKAA